MIGINLLPSHQIIMYINAKMLYVHLHFSINLIKCKSLYTEYTHTSEN